ncbi:MAG: hypothetical protein K6T28_05675 [Acidothermus sp.]|nr:hypothetical protein [Acidothermus sp.]
MISRRSFSLRDEVRQTAGYRHRIRITAAWAIVLVTVLAVSGCQSSPVSASYHAPSAGAATFSAATPVAPAASAAASETAGARTGPSGAATPTADLFARFGWAAPDPRLTPGETFPGVTAADVCTPGWATAHRNVSESTRLAVFAAYGIDYSLHANYELDHLIPLELGGDNSPRNLWPEPLVQDDPHSGKPDKDQLENHLHDLVCHGQLSLPVAQHAIATNWLAAWYTYEPIPITGEPIPHGSVTVTQSSSSPPAISNGCTARVSNPRPPRYSTVDIFVQTSPSAQVTATAHYKTKDTVHTTTADASGRASVSFSIAGATVGYTVIVDVTAATSATSAHCTTSFTPTD